MIELKTYYCYNDKGKEVLWGRIIDFKTVKDAKFAVIYISKNPLGDKIHVLPITEVEGWLRNGSLWRKGKK